MIGASMDAVISDDDEASSTPPPDDDPPPLKGGGGSVSWAPLLALLALMLIHRLQADTLSARGLLVLLLAAFLTGCDASVPSPANTLPTTSSAQDDVTELGVACVYFEKPAPIQSNTGPEGDYRAMPLPLLATGARPASVDPAGTNEIDVEERKVVTVAVAAMTDALQRGLVGGPGHAAGMRGGTFRVAWGPQLTLTLLDCAYTADVSVSGLVTWAHSDILEFGGLLADDRPLTADLIVSGPGTAGGTLHIAGSWQSNDPKDNFRVTGTLGGKKVAVLVPEA